MAADSSSAGARGHGGRPCPSAVGVHTDIVSMNPLELLARTGFLVKGLLYIVIGVLALQVVTGLGGRVTGTLGALMTVLGQPFGRTLLLIAAISLFGYAVWRVLQGLLD